MDTTEQCPKCNGSGWMPNTAKDGSRNWTPLLNDALPCSCGALVKTDGRWSVCCDFHDTPEEISAHLKRWEAEYGKTVDGKIITPPAGWKILPYRAVVPHVHREYDDSAGWLQPRRCHSTMTPIWARPTRYTRAYAVPT